MFRIDGKELYDVTMRARRRFKHKKSGGGHRQCKVESPEGGRLAILFTDLESHYEVILDGEGAIPSPALIDVDQLYKICQKSKKREVRIDVTEDGAPTIEVGVAHFELATPDIEDFPDVNVSLPKRYVTIPPEVTAAMSDLVPFAATDAARPSVTHINMKLYASNVEGGTLRATATDGHRLVSYGFDDEALADAYREVIGPEDCMIKAADVKMLGDVFDAGSPVEVGVVEMGTVLRQGDQTFWAAGYDGTYPDIQRILPDDGGIAIPTAVTAIVEQLDLAKLCLPSRTREVELALDDGQFFVSTKNGAGSFRGEVAVESHPSQSPVKVLLNHDYLGQALAIMGEKVILRITDTFTPVVLEDPEDPLLISLVMPILP